MPERGGSVRGCAIERGEMDAARDPDWFGGSRQNGRSSHAGAGSVSGLGAGADPGTARDRHESASGSAGRARRGGQPWHDPAVSSGLWAEFQKKTLVASERDRADVKRRRERWVRHQGRIDPKRLVFIDARAGSAIDPGDRLSCGRWVKTSMAPLRGRAPKGERRTANGERLPGAAGSVRNSVYSPPVRFQSDRPQPPSGEKRSSNVMANWFTAVSHPLTVLEVFSCPRIAR